PEGRRFKSYPRNQYQAPDLFPKSGAFAVAIVSSIADVKAMWKRQAGDCATAAPLTNPKLIVERAVMQCVAQDANRAGRGLKISRHPVPDPLLEGQQQIVRERQSTGAVRAVGTDRNDRMVAII